MTAGRRGTGRSMDNYLAIKIDASQIYCSSLKQMTSTWLRKTWHICLPELPKGFARVQQGRQGTRRPQEGPTYTGTVRTGKAREG